MPCGIEREADRGYQHISTRTQTEDPSKKKGGLTCCLRTSMNLFYVLIEALAVHVLDSAATSPGIYGDEGHEQVSSSLARRPRRWERD